LGRSTTKPLYLIALVPHLALRERIKALKDEMKEDYQASHALKSPAHITLQMPFRYRATDETRMLGSLRDFARPREAFQVVLSGFDCFPPRVLFVRVENHSPIVRLYDGLQQLLRNDLEFPPNPRPRPIHPHMTIATRDLEEDKFHEAWKAFESREFEAEFLADRLHLLKHNGSFWELFKEFPFQGTVGAPKN
jgi:2'-5' RNA ligase